MRSAAESAPRAETPHRALVVSIHDVSPRTWPAVARMLADLRRIGVGRTSLLVVPDHHRQGHFLKDAAFCREIERLAAEGHEVVVHGYYHQRTRPPAKETAWARFVTRVYTADEGEFYDLPAPAAAELLALARSDFDKLDLPSAPVGFIAPAWLLGDEAARAVREAGFAYTTRLGSVVDFTGARGVRSQSLVYSCRNAWRRQVSLCWNAWLFQRLRTNPLLRVGLHPPDAAHPAIWEQALRLVSTALRDGRASVTYADWMGMSVPGVAFNKP